MILDRTQQAGADPDWRISLLADAVIQRMIQAAGRRPTYDRDEGRSQVAMSREQWEHHLAHLAQLATVGRRHLGLASDGNNLSDDFEGQRAADGTGRVARTIGHRKFIRYMAATCCAARGTDVDRLAEQMFAVVNPDPELGLTFQDYRTVITGNIQERVCAPIAALAECAGLLRQRVPYVEAAERAGLSTDQARDLSRFLGTKQYREEQKAGVKERWVALARRAGWSGAEFARRFNAAAPDHGQKTIDERTARNWLADGAPA